MGEDNIHTEETKLYMKEYEEYVKDKQWWNKHKRKIIGLIIGLFVLCYAFSWVVYLWPYRKGEIVPVTNVWDEQIIYGKQYTDYDVVKLYYATDFNDILSSSVLDSDFWGMRTYRGVNFEKDDVLPVYVKEATMGTVGNKFLSTVGVGMVLVDKDDADLFNKKYTTHDIIIYDNNESWQAHKWIDADVFAFSPNVVANWTYFNLMSSVILIFGLFVFLCTGLVLLGEKCVKSIKGKLIQIKH